MQRLSSYISSELEDALNETLTSESKKFSDKVERFISEYDKKCKVSGADIQGIDMADFNAKHACASWLRGDAVYGGLGRRVSLLWNLGVYILVAKGESSFNDWNFSRRYCSGSFCRVLYRMTCSTKNSDCSGSCTWYVWHIQ